MRMYDLVIKLNLLYVITQDGLSEQAEEMIRSALADAEALSQ